MHGVKKKVMIIFFVGHKKFAREACRVYDWEVSLDTGHECSMPFDMPFRLLRHALVKEGTSVYTIFVGR